MNLTKVEYVNTLVRTAKTLKGIAPSFRKKTEDPSCDKHGFRFGGDSRFSVFTCKVFLDCHTGYYGNSSCSAFAHVDNALAEKALNVILNRRRDAILEEMAEVIMEEAHKSHAEAKKELESYAAALDLAATQPEE